MAAQHPATTDRGLALLALRPLSATLRAVMTRKKIKGGQKVEVRFSPSERVLVLERTFTGPELTTALRRAKLDAGKYVVRYTLDDLDELLGFVAAEANHSTDKKLRKDLDALYARVRREMESYDDGLWQQAF